MLGHFYLVVLDEKCNFTKYSQCVSLFCSPFPPSEMNRGGRVEPTPPECALAAEMFDHFCSAGTMKQILALHREICNTLNMKPNRLPDFYPKLKVKAFVFFL